MQPKSFVTLIIIANLVLLSDSKPKNDNSFPVAIIHINDFHARYEETSEKIASCSKSLGEKCVGGYARIVATVKNLQQKHKIEKLNPIYLNAGDNFQGTLWYDILRWNVTSHFLNLLPADAITIGNHEFDHGIEGLVPFLKTLNSTVIVSNIDDSNEPTFQGLYKKSIVVDRYRKKIGIIGVALQNFQNLKTIGNLMFLDEVISIIDEASKLKENGVDIIIVLSHCGLDKDIEIAKKVGSDVDVIVGGHSHTFMFTGDVLPGPDIPEADYPTIITQDDDHKVLIVQAAAYSKYVGNLIVWFDENGEIEQYEGNPIYLDENVVQDTSILNELTPFKEIVDRAALFVVGESKINFTLNECNYGECNIGNLVTDAYVYSWMNKEKNVDFNSYTIALEQRKDLRIAIPEGEITYGDLKLAYPFDNTIDSFDIRGYFLWKTIEDMFSFQDGETMVSNWLQTSGLKIIANLTMPVGQRVTSIKVLCRLCKIPVYIPLNPNEIYRVITTNYFAMIDPAHEILRWNKMNYKTGDKVFEVVQNYIKMMSPLTMPTSERLQLNT